MPGFFLVTDIPSRRVVEFRRVASQNGSSDVTYIEDESVLGKPKDVTPFSDKTGVSVPSGSIYEVPYLPDVGDVYFVTQPKDGLVDSTLSVEAKAGTAPYSFQWYKDDKQVVNVPASKNSLKAGDAGIYFCVVTDAEGTQAVSSAATVSAKTETK